MNKPSFDCLAAERESLLHFIRNAFLEDVGDGDHTSLACIRSGSSGRARLLVKDHGILAGVALAQMIFHEADPNLKVTIYISDGTPIAPGDIVLEVTGDDQKILIAERLVLNCMQRMSGIATTTARYVKLIEGTGAQVLDTRKTTPGLRILEKWAVRIGGGTNHRMGLYDMILIKDNHVDYAGGITAAITAANEYLKKNGRKLEIEIEVRNFQELNEALATGKINRIMLDNFNPEDLKSAVSLIAGRFDTEASGGITEKTIREYALTGVNYISVGALTHSVKSIDLSLKAVKDIPTIQH